MWLHPQTLNPLGSNVNRNKVAMGERPQRGRMLIIKKFKQILILEIHLIIF